MTASDAGAGLPLEVDPEYRDRVRVALFGAGPVAVAESGPAFASEVAGYGATLRERFAGCAPAEIEGLAAARRLYRAFGIDPTKTRPSSEALLRRVLRDRPFPRISNAVDVGNLLALRYLLPIGLYDEAKLRGPVRLRAGAEGEAYRGVRKETVHLAGRPVLADEAGAFGNPTADSARTAVDPGTSRLWMVIFAPAGFPGAELRRHLQLARRTMERHLASPGEPFAGRGAVDEDGRIVRLSAVD